MSIALTSATGKLGSAVLRAILDNNLVHPAELVVCTSSDPNDKRFDALRTQSVTVRYNNFDDPNSLEHAFAGCQKLFLVSTPKIEMDYNDAPLWKGREAHHRAAIDSAVKAGVKHIYYTSLAFASPSKAAVMRAHIRTEKYLHDLASQAKIDFTILREGLYNESWPLYFGYYFALLEDKRQEVVVAGDGPISWTAIDDMAFGTAKIVVAPSEHWKGKTVYLSQNTTWTLDGMSRLISTWLHQDVHLKIVSREEYVEHYASKGRDRASVEWWSSTYDALKDGECDVKDTTLESILRDAGKVPKSLEATMEEMMQPERGLGPVSQHSKE